MSHLSHVEIKIQTDSKYFPCYKFGYRYLWVCLCFISQKPKPKYDIEYI